MPAGPRLEIEGRSMGAPGMGVLSGEAPNGLRPRRHVPRRDANSLMPDLGPLSGFYAGVGRQMDHGKDGLVLITHHLTSPLPVVAQDYAERSGKPDWSPAAATAWHRDHFAREPVMLTEFQPTPGIPIEQYTQEARRFLTVPPEMQPNGLTIQLEYPVTAAGGDRFYPFWYGWDVGTQNYGLKTAGEIGQIRNNVDNAEDLIDLLGEEPNANTRFQATRGQMPYIVDGITLMYEHFGEEGILRYLDTVETQWNTKMDGMEELSHLPIDGNAHARKRVVRMADGSYLNRYYDSKQDRPREEMMTEDEATAEYAVSVKNLTGAEADRERKRMFNEIRVAAASGRDFSVEHLADPSRPETICVSEVVPVDLNSKMYHMEQFLALGYTLKAAKSFGLEQEEYLRRAHYYEAFAAGRRDSMEDNLRDPQTGMLRNKNARTGKFMPVVSASMGWALMYGEPSDEATFGIVDAMEEHLLSQGGIMATNAMESDEQWDSDRVWGNNTLVTVLGSARMHHKLKDRAHELRARGRRYDPDRLLNLGESARVGYTGATETIFEKEGHIREKFRGNDPLRNGHWGEYRTVPIFGMAVESNAALNAVDLTQRDGVIWLDPIQKIREDLGLVDKP